MNIKAHGSSCISVKLWYKEQFVSLSKFQGMLLNIQMTYEIVLSYDIGQFIIQYLDQCFLMITMIKLTFYFNMPCRRLGLLYFTKMEMPSYCRNFQFWLHCKLWKTSGVASDDKMGNFLFQCCVDLICSGLWVLTHWGRDKMAAIFQTTFSNAFSWMKIYKGLIMISLEFVPEGPINNIPALVQIKAWRRSGDEPLSEPMMVLITDTYMRHSASMS